MNRYFTFITLAVLWPVFALAGIIRVPQDQPTIQAGINAALNGDTVLVAENTYYENIKFLGKAITVASLFILDGDTNHINNTVINGSQPSHPDSGSVVYFVSGEDTNSVLTGFTVTGGSGTSATWPPNLNDKEGGGIFVAYSGAKIEKNKIIQNHITAAGDTAATAAGIFASGDIGDYIIIRDNEISQNSATATGTGQPLGAVFLWSKDTCLFESNRVSNNDCYAAYAYGGGLCVYGEQDRPGPYIIRNNIISDNRLNTPGSGGGGMLIENCSPILTNNIISGNVAGLFGGGGIWILHWTPATGIPEPELINNTITNNSTTGNGGGIRVSTITNNSTTGNGGSIRVSGSAQPFVKVMNTILWGNSAPTGPQIAISNGGTIEVRYSDVQGSWPGDGNIDADPLLVADSLSNASPCIGAGIHSYDFGGGVVCNCPGEDINGRMRPYPAGSHPDMGAWESKEGLVGIEPQPLAEIPKSYALFQNYPNPFNPSTTIEFALPKAGFVTLTIYNVAGEKVATLVSENLAAGSYKYQWDVRGLASGVYFYRLEAGSPSTGSGQGFVQTKKMLLIR